jgi:hypothetical protein
MVVSREPVSISEAEMASGGVLAASESVLGNGVVETVADIVYVRPESFEARYTRAIAAELEPINRRLQAEARPYLLLGYGRWGSADPWLGIPVEWSQINGARVIVEATRPEMSVDPSQGSHFFHNITSFQVSYFWIHHDHRPGIDWEWLAAREAETETRFLRHLRLDQPLLVKVDGRRGVGGIWHEKPVPRARCGQ